MVSVWPCSDNTFAVRVTHQETLQVHTRAGTGVIATRALAMDFDNSGQNLTFGFFDLATSLAQPINPTRTLAQAQEVAAKQIGYNTDYINSASGKSIADASDAASRGWELELQFNPTRYLTLKVTGNQRKPSTPISRSLRRSSSTSACLSGRRCACPRIVYPTVHNWWARAICGGPPRQAATASQ